MRLAACVFSYKLYINFCCNLTNPKWMTKPKPNRSKWGAVLTSKPPAGPSPAISPERLHSVGEHPRSASQWYLMIFIIMTSVGIVAPIIFCVFRRYCSLPPIPQRPMFISYRAQQVKLLTSLRSFQMQTQATA